jgi:peptidoglycan/xylan/chitin deacetylase (PgdA/CDA1 family)
VRRIKLPVLMYHHVGSASVGPYSRLTIEPSDFEKQIRWLAAHGYSTIRSQDWIEWRQNQRALPQKPIMITFDDGYADVIKYALPLLHRYHFTALIFVVTSLLGRTNEWDELDGWGPHRLVTAAQIREWASLGFEFGAHSRTHRNLTTLSAKDVQDEIVGSSSDLERILGTRPVSFAFPWGATNDLVSELAGRTFDLCLTVEEGFNFTTTDRCNIRRLMVNPNESLLGFICRLRLGFQPWACIRRTFRLRSRIRALLKQIECS